jgi:hypothetical protein
MYVFVFMYLGGLRMYVCVYVCMHAQDLVYEVRDECHQVGEPDFDLIGLCMHVCVYVCVRSCT